MPATMPEEITLSLNKSDIEIVSQALVQLPYGTVAPLINKLQQQVQKQLVPQVPVTDAPAGAPDAA